jgi:hypothetical protein
VYKLCTQMAVLEGFFWQINNSDSTKNELANRLVQVFAFS